MQGIENIRQNRNIETVMASRITGQSSVCSYQITIACLMKTPLGTDANEKPYVLSNNKYRNSSVNT